MRPLLVGNSDTHTHDLVIQFRGGFQGLTLGQLHFVLTFSLGFCIPAIEKREVILFTLP